MQISQTIPELTSILQRSVKSVSWNFNYKNFMLEERIVDHNIFQISSHVTE